MLLHVCVDPGSVFDCDSFGFAPFHRDSFSIAPFDCAPFDCAPFDFAQGKQGRQGRQAREAPDTISSEGPRVRRPDPGGR